MQTAFWFYVSPLAIPYMYMYVSMHLNRSFENVLFLIWDSWFQRVKEKKIIVQIIIGRSLMYLHLPTIYINHSNFHGNTNAHVLCYQTHLDSIWECNWSWSHLFADKELFQSIDKRCILFGEMAAAMLLLLLLLMMMILLLRFCYPTQFRLMHVISSSKLKIKNSFCKLACQQFVMFIASDAARISSIGER